VEVAGQGAVCPPVAEAGEELEGTVGGMDPEVVEEAVVEEEAGGAKVVEEAEGAVRLPPLGLIRRHYWTRPVDNSGDSARTFVAESMMLACNNSKSIMLYF
jgi:hypothetical protein